MNLIVIPGVNCMHFKYFGVQVNGYMQAVFCRLKYLGPVSSVFLSRLTNTYFSNSEFRAILPPALVLSSSNSQINLDQVRFGILYGQAKIVK